MLGTTGAPATLPVLYSFRRCPYAMRARLALSVSGLPYELREVMLRDKPPELLAASPKGTVPALLLPDGEVIDQSLDIMQWALRQADPQGWLTPPGGRSEEMQVLIAANDGPFKQQLDRYKYPNRYAQVQVHVQALTQPQAQAQEADEAAFAKLQRDAAACWLAELELRLAEGWLIGNAPSLADMALAPFIRQFAHTDTAWFAAQAWPRLAAWLARFEASALYAGVMEKYPAWQSAGAMRYKIHS